MTYDPKTPDSNWNDDGWDDDEEDDFAYPELDLPEVEPVQSRRTGLVALCVLSLLGVSWAVPPSVRQNAMGWMTGEGQAATADSVDTTRASQPRATQAGVGATTPSASPAPGQGGATDAKPRERPDSTASKRADPPRAGAGASQGAPPARPNATVVQRTDAARPEPPATPRPDPVRPKPSASPRPEPSRVEPSATHPDPTDARPADPGVLAEAGRPSPGTGTRPGAQPAAEPSSSRREPDSRAERLARIEASLQEAQRTRAAGQLARAECAYRVALEISAALPEARSRIPQIQAELAAMVAEIPPGTQRPCR